MVGANVTVRIPDKAIRSEIQNVENLVKRTTKDRKEAMLEVVKDAIDPWVPYKTGQLAGSATVTDKGIVYSATSLSGYNYASIQYHMPFNHTAPLATDHWDKVAWPYVKEAVAEQCSDILKKKLRGTKHGG